MSARVLAGAGVLALATACGGGRPPAVEETTDLAGLDQVASSRPAAVPPPSAEPSPPRAPAGSEQGAIRRADLDAVLAEGPGALLARVTTEPARVGGRFAGFRITGFPAGPPAAVDLRVGDVLRAVNGRRIERPEHYFEAFRSLSGAGELRLDLYRDGAREVLVYPIVD